MRNKLNVPWFSRLFAGRLFQWRRGCTDKDSVDHKMLIEEDYDHLGAMHAAARQSKQR